MPFQQTTVDNHEQDGGARSCCGLSFVRFSALVVIVMVVALMRLLPNWHNFSPIAAVALFGGAHFARKRWAFIVPLAAMLLSDLLLYSFQYREYQEYLFPFGMFVYGSFALIVCLGLWLRKQLKSQSNLAMQICTIGLTTLAGSILFFLTTNFGSWVWDPQYTKNLSGLMASYAAGLPFFRGTLLGDLVYVTLLFGGFALAQKPFPALREAPVTIRS